MVSRRCKCEGSNGAAERFARPGKMSDHTARARSRAPKPPSAGEHTVKRDTAQDTSYALDRERLGGMERVQRLDTGGLQLGILQAVA